MLMNPAAIMETLGQVLGKVQDLNHIREPDPEKATYSKRLIEEIGQGRGRPLIYPMVPTGRGSGPFIELVDGSVKMDLITGIGVHLFGHGHPELILAALKASLKAPTMQGTLMPGKEYGRLSQLLLQHTREVPHLGPEASTRLDGVWLTTCGTMANELALKIIRQKKAPAYKVISFKNCFAGRSTAMQELTDEPKYREGQPTFDQFQHIDFFDSDLGLSENIERTQKQIDAILEKEPGLYCGLGFEPIQGEGGAFRGAPTEWWRAVLTHARSKGLALWFDEVQTFGRTGELFAFQRLGLGEFVDVVSLAKPLHAAAVMWTPDYLPKPGLIAGTFAGGTVALSLGIRILEMLTTEGFLGPEGRIAKLERFILEDWEERKARVGQKLGLGRAHVYGGMVAFEALDGKADTIKKVLDRLFQKGVIGFSAGRSPVFLRFLPPVGVITFEQWKMGMDVVEETLMEFSSTVNGSQA